MSDPDEPVKVIWKSATVCSVGSQIMIFGPNEVDVREALDQLVTQDRAQLITAVTQSANNWIGACLHPEFREEDCRVERFGLKTFISGPNELSVRLLFERIREKGARAQQPPHFEGGRWIAVLDEGGLQEVMHFK